MRKLLAIIALAAAFSSAATRTVTLGPDSVWTMQREGDRTSYSVTVPCTVAGALNEAGVFGENVMDRDNYKSIDKSVFDDAWVFSTEFDTKVKGMHHLLRFNGLNYRAEITLNGKVIASPDTTFGLFIEREFDISSLVKKHNTLKVKLWRAQSRDLNAGYVDWNPRPVDESMGITRPVELISTPDVVVKDIYVKPEFDPAEPKEADVIIKTTVSNLLDKPVSGVVRGIFDGGVFEERVSLGAGETRQIVVKKHVSRPRIWWSWDMGKPELYKLTVSFLNGGGEVSHSKSVNFGIRSITSTINERGHRQFYLNGRPVLVTSAGWTDDIFMQDTHESIKAQVEFVKDMGLNSIRFENIWGKDDYVYDLCDQMGLLALVGWSCQWEWEDYCGLPEVGKFGCINGEEVEALAVRYFHDQVNRLHNHVSIIGWLTGSDRIPNPTVEKEYLKIYEELEYRPYICSASKLTSLGGPSGNKMAGPYEYVGPDYWFIDTKFGGNYGFNTETGAGMNLPQAESLERMLGKENLWPLNGMWNYHCTTSKSHMNDTHIAVAAATGVYGAPESFEDFVRKVHALDYDATRSMYEAFRCNVPVSTGIVQWMLNSAWPSLYWQLYDWYLVPTSSYYGVKKGLKPIQLIYNYKEHAVYCVNDVIPEAEVKATIKVFDKDSRLIRTEEAQLKSKAREPMKVFDGIEGPCFVALELRNHKDRVIADNFYAVPEKGNEYDWKHTDWWGSPMTSYSDLSFVTALPAVELELKTNVVDGGYEVTVYNKSDVIAFQNILKAKDSEGQLIPAVKWSDNFFSVLPGEKRRVRCIMPEGAKATISLDGWNGSVGYVHAPDSLDRNRSAYATYNFSKDDVYQKDETYDIVSVIQPKGKKVKNIIFMIGDGMGFEQVSCGWVVNGGKLNMDAMPYFGQSRTYAVDRLVTDSPAGGCALAIGQKTKYGYIGMGPDGIPAESSLKKAQRLGKKTGVVVTCRINDATPADFVCYSPTRRDEEGIAAQYVDSGVDFISGGGVHFWTSRSDGRNLVEEMQAKGYTYVDKLEDVRGARGDRFLGLFDEYDLPPVTERGPVLYECTMKAIEMLDNKKGFFLMVEGSQIDDWAHRHKVGPMCEELFDFDKTLGAVLEWAEKDGQTLVVVTADHATGGLTLLKGSLEEHLIKVNYSTEGHNGIVVPVYAYGPRAEVFAGVHENGEVGQLVIDLVRK